MSSITRNSFKVFTAEQLKSSFSSGSEIYLTYGRSFAWANDSSPDNANTSVALSYEVWRYMIGGKLITGNNVRNVIPRYDWTANNVYIAYDDLSTEQNAVASYVVTTDWNVYKCLSNNSSSNSTVMPTSVSPNNSTSTSDGYIWKYMYSLSSEELLRFTTPSYIPVKTVLADDGSQQWLVQQGATIGDIQAIQIINPGTGYNTVPTITITGDGTSATAMAAINSISNTVSSITMTNPGSGYTNARVTITGGNGDASARAIISPPGGHGSDALYELGGKYLMINEQFDGSEGSTLPVTNEFRQVALLKNPTLYGTSNTATLSTFNQTTRISVTGVTSNFQADEFVYQGQNLGASTFSGRINQWDSGNNILYLIDTRGTPTSQTILGDTSAATGFITSVTNPDLIINTGRIMYVDNILPITRSEDQVDSFQILLSF